MRKPAFPMCELTEVLELPESWECVICGHEWDQDAAPAKDRVIQEEHGQALAEGDQDISDKIDGVALGLKACFVKKV